MSHDVHDAFPTVPHPQAAVTVISPWHTRDSEYQRQTAETLVGAWKAAPWPPGLLSASGFTSLDGEALLLYLQWTDEGTRREFFASRPGLADDDIAALGLPDSPRYVVYRSLGDHGDRNPTSMITATFDVDGPERQRHIADTLIAAADDLPPNPAALSSHFHLSVDGTRVVNVTFWNDDATHDDLADDGAFDEIYRLSTTTPGVRATRGRHYHLFGSKILDND